MTDGEQQAAGGVPYLRLEAGVDWLTLIDLPGRRRGEMLEWGRHILETERAAGAKVKPLNTEGYKGEQCSSIAIGSRPDSDYLRLSGSLAATWWTSLRSSTGRPSRLDVQTSIWFASSHTQFGSLSLSTSDSPQTRPRGRPPKVTTWQDNRGSWCGMVGSRKSRAYVRVYDKGIENEDADAGVHWRIELEAKRDLARKLWANLRTTARPAEYCLNMCEASLRSSGRSWLLPPRCVDVRLPAVDRREPPDVERTMKWLQQMVRPAIERLVPSQDINRLLAAVGLDGYAIALTDLDKGRRTA